MQQLNWKTSAFSNLLVRLKDFLFRAKFEQDVEDQQNPEDHKHQEDQGKTNRTRKLRCTELGYANVWVYSKKRVKAFWRNLIRESSPKANTSDNFQPVKQRVNSNFITSAPVIGRENLWLKKLFYVYFFSTSAHEVSKERIPYYKLYYS